MLSLLLVPCALVLHGAAPLGVAVQQRMPTHHLRASTPRLDESSECVVDAENAAEQAACKEDKQALEFMSYSARMARLAEKQGKSADAYAFTPVEPVPPPPTAAGRAAAPPIDGAVSKEECIVDSENAAEAALCLEETTGKKSLLRRLLTLPLKPFAWLKVLFFAHPTHFSHMSHPTFPISHILILFF